MFNLEATYFKLLCLQRGGEGMLLKVPFGRIVFKHTEEM